VAELELEILNQMHKRIVKDFLDMVILMELRKRSMSGYDFIVFVHNKFHVLMSSGTVYSYLHFLERNGLVKGERSRRRTVYTLTEQGKQNARAFLNSKDKINGLILNLFIGE
jgi:DNA-binding PadR family transcriptional regulator